MMKTGHMHIGLPLTSLATAITFIAVAPTAEAQKLVEDFSKRPAMIVHDAEKRGAEFSVVERPKPTQGEPLKEGLAGRFTWKETHQTFLEYYYQADVAIPQSSGDAGAVVLRLHSDTPAAVWNVAVRVKDATGEIFHFGSKAKLSEGTWEELAIKIANDAHTAHWSGDNDGQLDGPLLLTGYAVLVNDAAGAGGLHIAEVTWTPAEGSSAAAGHGAYRIDDAHLTQPFWLSQTVYGEAVAFVRDNAADPAWGSLLLTPDRVLTVRSSDGRTTYEEGRDFRVDAERRRLVLPEGSRIASLTRSELYRKPGEPRSIPAKADDPSTHLLYAEGGFTGVQVEVDYVRAEAWDGYIPTFAGAKLPRTLACLHAHEPLNVAVLGDSIAAGANASSTLAPPHMPPFVELWRQGLEAAYGSKVTVQNLAVGGATTESAPQQLAMADLAAVDLVVLAFGMNDVAARDPQAYAARLRGLMDAIRVSRPNVEFILVASSVANPQWSWSPSNQFPGYRDALASLTGPGAVLADATQLWNDILLRKQYLDLTGNGINHPNDYGHRLYAQLLISLLIPQTH